MSSIIIIDNVLQYKLVYFILRQRLSLADAQGISDIEELNAILDRAIELKEMLKSPDRVSKVAMYVARHFRENVEPLGFKAFLVAVDRQACAAYKEQLDKYLPAEYSQVVYSPLHNDSLPLKKFYLSEEGEKKVRKDFLKKNSLPKILIVTQKLLTGFDAPILYCMYLDKPMRDHVLLQAIARVNRPYEDEDGLVKPCGFVLDFVGIFEKLEKALAFDSDVVTSVIKNIDVLKMLFNTYMSDVAGKYLALAKGWDDKSKEKAIEYFQDKETRESFFWFFKQVQSIYDILSPDAFLRPFMDDYQNLARLYALILNAYTEIYVDREVTAKTRLLLQEYTSSGALELPGAIHQLGPRELKALKDSGTSDATKVLNLRKLIALSSKVSSNPILRLIGERAEALRQDYEIRQITTQEALERFQGLADDLLNADKERIRLGLDENSFAIYSRIKPETETKKLQPNQAKEINALFESYPDYRWDEKQEQRLRAKLYKFILPLVGKEKLTKLADDLLRLRRE